jgi:hypothetical protein
MTVRGRGAVGLVAGIAAVAVALALPAPKSQPTPAAGTAPASTGPAAATIAGVWPQAKPVNVTAIQPDGRTYTPLLVLDPNTSLGRLSSDDSPASAFVLRTGSEVRVLQGGGSVDSSDVVAEAATATGLFWIQVSSDANGVGRYTIWSANRDGTAPRVVTTDAGPVAVYSSEFDLQVADGRLYWLAAHAGAAGAVDLRSAPVGGGPVTVKPLDGNVALSTWPWVATAISQPGQNAELTNLVTGERRQASGAANEQLTCAPTWCLAAATGSSTATTLRLRRTDGSDTREIGTGDIWAAIPNVVLLDRFAVIAGTGVSTFAGANIRLSLFDLNTNRLIQVSPAAVDVASREGFLWWSDGVAESLTWHILDLRALT